MIVDIHAARTNLSRLIEQACAGEEVVIARDSEPVVRLVPVERQQPRRKFGAMMGRYSLPNEFFDPLPAEELEAWSQ